MPVGDSAIAMPETGSGSEGWFIGSVPWIGSRGLPLAGVTDERPLAWFHALAPDVQAALLADPFGYLPDGVAAKIPDRVLMAAHWTELDSPRRWQLHVDEARRLEDERRRRGKE